MILYLKHLKIHLKSSLQYKLSFILSFIGQFISFFGYYFTITCLFNTFSNIKGFTLYEVLLTFSIIQFGYSFNETFFRGVDKFDDLIISGNFDRLLTKPRNILLQVFCQDTDFMRIGKVIQSIIILIIAVLNIDVIWTYDKIITLTCMHISSVVIFLGIFILAASYCFVTVKGLEVRNVFTDGGKHMAQYPIGIFKKGFIYFFTFIIPFGFVNYYPLLYILGEKTNKILMISPLITIIYLIPCIIIFYKGVKRYTGTGS